MYHKVRKTLKNFIKQTSHLVFLTVPLLAFANYAIPSGPMAAHWCIDGVVGCNGPLLSQWSPNNLLSQFYQNKTPLAKIYYLHHNQNKIAIIPYVGFSTSQTPIQMQVGISNVPEILFWQYIPTMVYFGGSQSEGQVLAPSPGWIKAAHQNGVRILGNIFFSPTVYGGDKEIKALDNLLVHDKNGVYPMVNRLIAIAQAYGFDGYFINEETDESTNRFNAFQGFIDYFHQRCQQLNLHLSLYWYQVPAYSLNTNLLMHNGKRVADNVFLDYSWQDASPQVLTNQAKSVGYPIQHLEFGINAENANTGSLQQNIFQQIAPNQNLHYGSISEFDYGQILTQGNHNTNFQQQMQNAQCFWLGTNCFNGNNGWNGADQYVATHTAILNLPFSTFFNTGHGSTYFINGQQSNIGAWSDISLQSYMPNLNGTHSNSTLKEKFDYDHAYDGGSSLAISGRIAKGFTATYPLYTTHFTLNTNNVINLTYQLNNGSIARLNICLKTNNGENCLPILSNTNAQWKNVSYNLTNMQGQVINQILIKINSETAGDLDLHLGKIFIGNKSQDVPPASPTNVHIVKKFVDNNGNLNTYIAWNNIKGAILYDVYNNGQLLEVTPRPIIDVIQKSGQYNSASNIDVQAVNSDGQQSNPTYIN